MTTKAQEKKALEQIMKIVAELGENSYVGTAIDGMLEDAEDNIECDAAFSYKGRYETAERDLAKMSKMLDEHEDTIRFLKAENDKFCELNRIYGELENECNEFQSKTDKAMIELGDKVLEMGKQLECKDLEIMKLKAKLYDLIMKDAE